MCLDLFLLLGVRAYDSGAWVVLYDSSGESPWADVPGDISGGGKYFDVEAFASTRFRIRNAQANPIDQSQCMHIRGLELFGTVLPPWRQAY